MEDLSQKQVRIIMSFGSKDPMKKREAALTFTVIKRMTKQYAEAEKLPLDVRRCVRYTGEITEPLFEEMAKADIVIAILDEINPTVIFELAFRHTLRGQFILIVKDRHAIPFYLRTWAYVELGQDLLQALNDEVENENMFPTVSFEQCPLSPRLEQLLRKGEGCEVDLRRALAEELRSEPAPTPYFEDVVLPLLHQRIVSIGKEEEDFGLGPWARSSFYPLSIIRVNFKKMSHIEDCRYDPTEDIDGDPIVYDANRGFLKIFNLKLMEDEKIFPQLRRMNPLTFSSILELLSGERGHRRLAHKDWDSIAFGNDQKRLRKWVIFYDAQAATSVFCERPKDQDLYAHEPIHLADDHPVEEMRGASFLPCLIAKRRSGLFPNGPHSAYLRIAFIDVTNVAADASRRLKGAPVG
jgi:hypothetical protein